MPPEREYLTRSANYFLVRSMGVDFRWWQEGCCLAICEIWEGNTLRGRSEFRLTGDLEHTVEVYQGDMEKKL